MKKWLLGSGLGLIMTTSIYANNKIAVVNMSTLFLQEAQKTGVSAILEKEFKERANELERMENDLQNKIQHFQRDSSTMKVNERNKLEKDMITQRQTFSQKAQSFEQDRQRRSNEERDKLLFRIQSAVKKVASNENIDLVIDTNAVAFNSNDIQDITVNVVNILDRSNE